MRTYVIEREAVWLRAVWIRCFTSSNLLEFVSSNLFAFKSWDIIHAFVVEKRDLGDAKIASDRHDRDCFVLSESLVHEKGSAVAHCIPHGPVCVCARAAQSLYYRDSKRAGTGVATHRSTYLSTLDLP